MWLSHDSISKPRYVGRSGYPLSRVPIHTGRSQNGDNCQDGPKCFMGEKGGSKC